MSQTEPLIDRTPEDASPKRDYHTPVLQDLGRVADVTAAGGSAISNDGSTGYS